MRHEAAAGICGSATAATATEQVRKEPASSSAHEGESNHSTAGSLHLQQHSDEVRAKTSVSSGTALVEAAAASGSRGKWEQGLGDRKGKHNWKHLAGNALPPHPPSPSPCPAAATGLGMVPCSTGLGKHHHHAESSKKRKVLFTGEHTKSRAAGNITQG